MYRGNIKSLYYITCFLYKLDIIEIVANNEM